MCKREGPSRSERARRDGGIRWEGSAEVSRPGQRVKAGGRGTVGRITEESCYLTAPPPKPPSSPPPTSPCPSETQRMAEQHASGRPVMWQAGGCGVLSVDIHSCFPGVSRGREGGMVGRGGTLRHVMKESILHKRSALLVGPKSSLRPLKWTVYKNIAKAESHYSFIPRGPFCHQLLELSHKG